MVCYIHIDEIISALGINNVGCEVSDWRLKSKSKSEKLGAQIDLVIDRGDNAITLCEVKYSRDKYSISKLDASALVQKMQIFEGETKTDKQIYLAIVTSTGYKKNIWSEDLVSNFVEIKDLF